MSPFFTPGRGKHLNLKIINDFEQIVYCKKVFAIFNSSKLSNKYLRNCVCC